MSAYTASEEEAILARDLLKDWASEGFLRAEQREAMASTIACDLRRTNVFLRAVLFLFTLLVVAALAGLTASNNGVAFFVLAATSYITAELCVSRARLYRYGIEEALAACSVGLLCGSIDAMFPNGAGAKVAAVGALASIWIWHRFGLPYAPLAAMFFVPWMVSEWTLPQSAQHALTAAIYAAALAAVAAIRRPHRLGYLNQRFSIAEALLWLGIYAAINLKLWSANILGLWSGRPVDSSEFPQPFYWTTWALTWCLPPIILARGIQAKDRFVIIAGIVTAILTLVTNKLYLGWERHTWDPMILGALLIATALLLRRWLAQGPNETRRGFTARSLSGSNKEWMNAGSTTIGLASPSLLSPGPQAGGSDVPFDGGKSGGAGASSDF